MKRLIFCFILFCSCVYNSKLPKDNKYYTSYIYTKNQNIYLSIIRHNELNVNTMGAIDIIDKNTIIAILFENKKFYKYSLYSSGYITHTIQYEVMLSKNIYDYIISLTTNSMTIDDGEDIIEIDIKHIKIEIAKINNYMKKTNKISNSRKEI